VRRQRPAGSVGSSSSSREQRGQQQQGAAWATAAAAPATALSFLRSSSRMRRCDCGSCFVVLYLRTSRQTRWGWGFMFEKGFRVCILKG
jgi:hypothetical protein